MIQMMKKIGDYNNIYINLVLMESLDLYHGRCLVDGNRIGAIPLADTIYGTRRLIKSIGIHRVEFIFKIIIIY
tara:strand:+ start:116 stop:334 length:219 start_codon:yes stop_codon:yes gene_type:complete